MSFKSSNLNVLAYTNDFTLWHYVTDDALLEGASEGYFDREYDWLHTGDMLFMNIGSAATSVMVKSVVDGRVTIDNLTPLNSKE